MSNVKDAAKLRRLACREQDELRARRLRASALVLGGASISAAARTVGMDRARLSHWMALYRAHGVAGLDDRRPKKAPLVEWQVECLEIRARGRKPLGPAELARHALDAWEVEIGAAAIREILREQRGLVWQGGCWVEGVQARAGGGPACR